MSKLYKHVTDGGAEYLTTTKDDLYTTVVRLDGEPELFDKNLPINTSLLEALKKVEGMCNMPEVKQAMMKHEQAYYHSVMDQVRKAIRNAE